MKLEAALITVNSPYAEVRAVVDNHDDVNIPCGTIRAVRALLSADYDHIAMLTGENSG